MTSYPDALRPDSIHTGHMKYLGAYSYIWPILTPDPGSPSPTSITPLRASTLHDKGSPFSPLGAGAGGFSGDSSHRRRVTHHDRGNPNLDPEEDLAKNREFYRLQDVRPPYTYAALIRTVGEIF